MELDQLRYFLKLAEMGNFTRAAEELLISQPALSRSIQKLEEELGVPLLVRKSKATDLTDAGVLMKSRAEQIMAIIDDTKAGSPTMENRGESDWERSRQSRRTFCPPF
ncbi:LysR family transcriptional regulator [Rhodopirellula sp. MGV]|uniref:LysR family transcriptional regulator n=1 Tax=Rhodopirellula sp. MGV TaxID=2023130 RepID=UPI001E456ECD|nr:LysR family transcriptional regulator [Rhodopirellula sp. MGV]